MFRFFRRDHLKSSRRRSASCPNLQQTNDFTFDGEYLKGKPVDDCLSSDSDTDEHDAPNNKVRAERFVGKENRVKCNQSNLLCIDDYLSKLPELKLWLKEERGRKDVEHMKSPKLKSHFKVFMKLWNKKKLPAKYYTDEVFNSIVTSHTLLEPLAQNVCAESCVAESLPPLPPLLDISVDNTLDEEDSSHGAPFSTFGKTPDKNSPAFLAQQMNVNKCSSARSKISRAAQPYQLPLTPSSATTKFATILRSTPVASLFKATSTLPSNYKMNTPVPSPKCPEQLYRKTPAALTSEKTFSETSVRGNADGRDFHTWVAGWNKFTNQSPIYETVADSLPVSSESPLYAEVDSGTHLESGYSSISPFKVQRSQSKTVGRQPLSQRRRSKSLEDIYSVVTKFSTGVGVRRTASRRDEVEAPPPIPDRNYSPFKAPSSPKTIYCRNPGSFKMSTAASSTPDTVKADLLHRLVGIQEISPKKRRSEEENEFLKDASCTVKKIKPELSAFDGNTSGNSLSSFESTPVLSILTGSMNPTTRSKYKLMDTSDSVTPVLTEKPKADCEDLNPIQLQQLEESPKLPRRRLKRRSSSLSTTPGKGLTFGKNSKLLVASPKRKVSFAKDVKDTDSNSTIRKMPSSRLVASPSVAMYTRQTKERVEFETFLSSHSAPKKGNSPNKTSSPGKPSSPNKCIPASKVQNCGGDLTSKQLTSPLQLLGGLKRKDSKLISSSSSSVHSEVSERENMFPPSPTRQLGRRVLGKPTSSLHKTNTCIIQTGQYFDQQVLPQKTSSQPKKVSPPKRVDSLILPKKTISSLVSKIGEKTANICANEMSESEGYSSSDDILNSAPSCHVTGMTSQHSVNQDVSSVSSLAVSDGLTPCFNVNDQKSSTLLKYKAESSNNFMSISLGNRSRECDKTENYAQSSQTALDIGPTLKYHSTATNGTLKEENASTWLESISEKMIDDKSSCYTKVTQRKPYKVKKKYSLESPIEGELNESEMKDDTGAINARCTKTENNSKASCEDFMTENTTDIITSGFTPTAADKSMYEEMRGLERLHSIRASPKITDDDGWITERRSSRGKVKSSFHSPYKKLVLTQQSSNEEKNSEDSNSNYGFSVFESTEISGKGNCSSAHLVKEDYLKKDVLHDKITLTPDNKEDIISPLSTDVLKSSIVELSAVPASDTVSEVQGSASLMQLVKITTQSTVHLQAPQAQNVETFKLSNLATTTPQSPMKIKPPVMPKPTIRPRPALPSKPATSGGPQTISAKRKSSINKSDTSSVRFNRVKENYIQKNINAVKFPGQQSNNPLCDGQKPDSSGDSGTRCRSKTVPRDSSSLSTSSRRRSKTVTQALTMNSIPKRRSSKIGGADTGAGLPANKRRSKTVPAAVTDNAGETAKLTVGGRRKSRTSNQNSKNTLPSFTERKNFFQKFQTAEDVKHLVRRNTFKPPVSSPAIAQHCASSQSGAQEIRRAVPQSVMVYKIETEI